MCFFKYIFKKAEIHVCGGAFAHHYVYDVEEIVDQLHDPSKRQIRYGFGIAQVYPRVLSKKLDTKIPISARNHGIVADLNDNIYLFGGNDNWAGRGHNTAVFRFEYGQQKWLKDWQANRYGKQRF